MPYHLENTMAEKIGRFEIVSQLAQSPFATVYKANDAEAQQTVALKVVSLDRATDRGALTKTVFEESERAKSLGSHNIAGLYGVGDEGDLLLAAAEYVQGNSIATTLARHEGFSIWDLQDIARQVCQALDHAQVHQVVHQSLEPAKIMVQWDGLVKVLGFGISSMNRTAAASEDAPDVMHYFAPEQLRGEALDHRAAIFSLGAVLYEMATEQKAFAGSTAEQVRGAIFETTPPLPHRLKGNVNPALSGLIMKALSKDPNERFQSGQELVRELEQCKSAGGIAAKQASGAMAKAAPAVRAPAKEAPRANAAAAASSSSSAKPVSSPTPPNANAMAAPAVEEEPAFTVDPLMAEVPAEITMPSRSFSDVSELPPLQEVRVVEAAPTQEASAEQAVPEPLPVATFRKTEAEKAKLQVREIAQTAVREIRKTPPKLYVCAIGVAVAVIGISLGGFRLYNYFQDRDSSGQAPSTVAPPAAPQPPNPQPAQTPTPEAQQAPPPTEEPQAEEASEETRPSSPASPRGRKGKGRSATAAVVQAQLSVGSTPDGAEITFDGSALCQTPCTLTGIAPGQHLVTASKAGFAQASHTVSLESGANASVSLQLSQLTPIVSVSSNPAGAAIIIDGKDTGKLTPAQVILDKPGKHSITIRRYGYLESSNNVNVELGQTSTLNLDLTKLGSTEEIKAAGGKFKKVFARDDSSGQGIVSVKTQPKGAQIMVNNRVLDKTAPFDFYLNPGTYVIDITMNGYRPLHRVVNIQEGEKLAIQENLLPE
jgi:eukaryotic-like serine/threonine-protein kinase